MTIKELTQALWEHVALARAGTADEALDQEVYAMLGTRWFHVDEITETPGGGFAVVLEEGVR